MISTKVRVVRREESRTLTQAEARSQQYEEMDEEQERLAREDFFLFLRSSKQQCVFMPV